MTRRKHGTPRSQPSTWPHVYHPPLRHWVCHYVHTTVRYKYILTLLVLLQCLSRILCVCMLILSASSHVSITIVQNKTPLFLNAVRKGLFFYPPALVLFCRMPFCEVGKLSRSFPHTIHFFNETLATTCSLQHSPPAIATNSRKSWCVLQFCL